MARNPYISNKITKGIENKSLMSDGEGSVHYKNIKSTIDFVNECQPLIEEIRLYMKEYLTPKGLAEDRKDQNILRLLMNKTIEKLQETGIIRNDSNRLSVDILKVVEAEIFGFGLLEELLYDDSISEIMVVNKDKVYLERSGHRFLSPYHFPSNDYLKTLINKLCEPSGKRCDISNPNVDAILPNGARLSASIPPLRTNNEHSLTIRRFSTKKITMDDYVNKYHSMSAAMAEFLEYCVQSHCNIIVSGGTSSGKTTLLNALTSYIDKDERLLTMEDTPELQPTGNHIEAYQTRAANLEGRGAISMDDLLVFALRKAPRRIIVGECRGGETWTMLSAMNSGHDGSLTTVHSNSSEECISALAQKAAAHQDTKNVPEHIIRQNVAMSVNIIVQANYDAETGARRITQISEVVGYGEAGFQKVLAKDKNAIRGAEDQVYIRDIFKYYSIIDKDTKQQLRYYAPTGYIPYFAKNIEEAGHHVDDSMFDARNKVFI